MSKNFIFKVMGVLFLTLLMSLAVSSINSTIRERQYRQEDVKNQIALSSAGAQTIIGPVLVVPYVEQYPETITENNLKKTVIRQDADAVYILPEELNLEGGFTNQYKQLGIYKALMYQLGGQVQGRFKFNQPILPRHAGGTVYIKPAYLSISISDPRGFTDKPELTWDEKTIGFLQGTQLQALGKGIHAELGQIDMAQSHDIPFAFQLNLRGMENFNFAPIAENNKVLLRSSWQHPHFSGNYLPDPGTQKINSAGFEAEWRVSSISSNNQSQLTNGLRTANAATAMTLESMNIGFIEPINVYSLSDRATKYGLLFIGLTFAGFFIFELMKQLRIHPAQYTMVGLAMAMFYLLLISLSEHISFGASYFIASLACVSLLGYYLSYVLKSKVNGAIFATLLTALYGALYGILQSEDNALLMGSLLVFGLLALTMVITRKVDWYQISSKPTQNPAYAGYTA